MKINKQELLQFADQCVKCGQCLAVCPTYNLYQNEAESPRGRISLIQGLMHGHLDSTDKTTLLHLDHCLYCGNCESACPSGVNYIKLLDRSKQLYPVNAIASWQLDLLTNKKLFTPGRAASRFLPQRLKNHVPAIFQQALSLSTPKVKPVTYKAASATSDRKKIGIFTGCIGHQIDSKAINLTARLLDYCGLEAVIPRTQSCCGAIYQHEGHSDKAERLLQKNQQVFYHEDVEKVIFFASGCGTWLKQGDFSMPVIEATRFIASLDEVARFRASIEGKIAIHRPCSLDSSGKGWDIMLQLIQAIAGEQLVELPGNDSCCGSAGLHFLKHPQAARQLLAPKLQSLMDIAPRKLLTANTGCTLHFYNGIEERGLDIEVMHPAEWVSGLLLQGKDLSR
ncbi:MAG: (Fe-S)-binding protein [Gammaproteobacteria bacterium]|nr:(Fe-S)-binding protein [Gammaproteobacteria bacterium]NNJ93056.1 (Fe-S)-binding protein [Gammaproteobacteria bacterium]